MGSVVKFLKSRNPETRLLEVCWPLQHRKKGLAHRVSQRRLENHFVDDLTPPTIRLNQQSGLTAQLIQPNPSAMANPHMKTTIQIQKPPILAHDLKRSTSLHAAAPQRSPRCRKKPKRKPLYHQKKKEPQRKPRKSPKLNLASARATGVF